MAAAVSSLPCCSTAPPPPLHSSSRPLYLLLRPRPPRAPGLRLRHPHLLLPTGSRPGPIRCSSASYNGWADLPAADPDPLFFRIAAGPDAPLFLLLLLLLPAVAALSLSRLPPVPLLAATFAAGFATARHLAPPPSSHSQRLAALLADLDARLLSFKDRLLSSSSPDDDEEGLVLQSLDRARDAVRECAAAAYGQAGGSSSPSGDALRDVAREVAAYLGGWLKDALRDLSFASSPRKKPVPKVVAPAAAAPVADSKSDSDAASVAHVQQGDGDKHPSVPAGKRRAGVGEDRPLGSAVVGTARPLDMLPFDGEDAEDGSEDAGFSSESRQEDDRLDRLVFKHRYGHSRSGARNADTFAFEDGGGFATESTESSLLERTLEIRDRSYRLKIERRNGGESRASGGARKMPADKFMGNSVSADEPALSDDEAMGSDAEEFSRNVKEAAEILRKARECMMARDDEETADALLYKSARLLSTAVALRPTSLAAVGQLGNTYLLHGELKLKISRELRTLLANSGAYLSGKERVSRSRKLDRRILNKENISSALVDVCEECESLLVEAGRSYRTAVSIDSGDVKALYNWGLALIFRGQLLADIGPEAAVDADRVYLAAIDKFDAMLSKSNTYAPEALYRWGSALQQRSQLRSRNNKEKIRLLEQAKSLFEDVLYVEGNNKMVREALSSCISELNYHGRWLQ